MKEIDEEKLVARGVGLFREGYNCSQSVALAFAEYYDIPEALMARFAASFGAGIGRMRLTCGAACGMFMLAGLEVQNDEDRKEELNLKDNPYPSQSLKRKNYEVVQQLAADFKAVTGSINCGELLGLNKQRADGKLPEISPIPEARTDEYYKKRPCVRMVEAAVRVYCKYLQQK